MMTQEAAVQQPTRMNGLSVQAAFDTIDAIKANPNLARFQFRARNRWIDRGETARRSATSTAPAQRTIRAR